MSKHHKHSDPLCEANWQAVPFMRAPLTDADTRKLETCSKRQMRKIEKRLAKHDADIEVSK